VAEVGQCSLTIQVHVRDAIAARCAEVPARHLGSSFNRDL
jgi:hypothetical protein